MTIKPDRLTHNEAISGEYIERGRDPEQDNRNTVYREFDGLGETHRKVLSLIAERIRTENASAEYQKMADERPDIRRHQAVRVNLRA